MRSWWIFTILTLFFVTTMVTFVIANPQDTGSTLDAKKALTQSKSNRVPGQTKIASAPNLDKPHPLINFEELTHDFGSRISGDELHHVFLFENTGDADLVIERVKGG